MAVGFPVKDDYATGDVLTAANMNDFAGTLNTVITPLGNAAGKNKIINGDFAINQRGFSTATTTTGTLDAYGVDRFINNVLGGTGTVTNSVQTFTPGAAPVAGYEGTQFLRIETSGQTAAGTLTRLEQRIEDVRTFAGQTITISFWAKANTGTPNVQVNVVQFFGTGGSATVATTTTKKAITTSWARYSFTIAIPSISSKTIGTGITFLSVRINLSAGTTFSAFTDTLGIQSNTFDIWGVQAEAGSIATPFQTATGTIQGELAAAQRYYYRMTNDAIKSNFGVGFNDSTTSAAIKIPFKQTMRITPTALEQTGTAADYAVRFTGLANSVCNAVPTFSTCNPDEAIVIFTVASGLTGGQACMGRAAAANAYLGWSAEL
jgi:hypothetical protein